MKSIFTLLCVAFVTFASAQEISNEFKIALKNDDASVFLKQLGDTNKNACYEAGKSNYSLLALSIKFNAESCFKVLLQKNVNLEQACASKTPLMYAAKYGNLSMARALIKAGANPNTKSIKGRTALDYANKYKQADLVDFLSSL